jgi:hypothetical protein
MKWLWLTRTEEISAARVLNTLSVDHQQGLPSMPHDTLLQFTGSSSHTSAVMGSAVLLRQEWWVVGGGTWWCYVCNYTHDERDTVSSNISHWSNKKLTSSLVQPLKINMVSCPLALFPYC